MINTLPEKPVVFYDGSCPLCSKEIAHYQKCTGADQLNWLDISASPDQLKQYGVTLDQTMSQFHVLSKEGQFQVGAYGFVYLWSFLKPYAFISLLLTKLKLVKPLNWFYIRFARWRLKRSCTDNCSV